MLANRFGRNKTMIRADRPLSDEQMQRVAPSIFAVEKHDSRSARYSYIPTITILNKLREEGFSPFMVCQTRTRDGGKREHTKHMIRLRHASQINGQEANEIILLNSHDGTSAYQMYAGVLRFVCENGLVCGSCMSDIRVPHKGNVQDNVIEGAFRVVDDFKLVDEQKEGMKLLTLDKEEQIILAHSAIVAKYGESETVPQPITEEEVLGLQRREDDKNDLWTTFNRIQENLLNGGLRARTPKGSSTTTRPITGIDQGVKLNRALWLLSERMRLLRSK